MSKSVFGLWLLLISSGLMAQQQTDIIYLDFNDKPVSNDRAVRYARVTHEAAGWKQEVYDIEDKKLISITYYSDSLLNHAHGPYTLYYKNNRVHRSGMYQDGEKSGSWKSFQENGRLLDTAYYAGGLITGIAVSWYENGNLYDSAVYTEPGKGSAAGYWKEGNLREKGDFEGGKKNGLWTYFHTSGLRAMEVQYSADSALSYTCYDENGKKLNKDCVFEREAAFPGGDRAWVRYLTAKLVAAKMPKSYYKGDIYGTVYIQFVVDTDGSITDMKAVGSGNAELQKIAMEIIRQSPAWNPAIQYNRKVKAYRRQPVTFQRVTE